MNGEIISVGTELLLGDILNTNAQFLSQELANLGITIRNQRVIGDNEERLLKVIDQAFEESDLIITTGGLGPTNDDITKEVVCKYFGYKLELDSESLRYIEEYFNKLGKPMAEMNKKQAYFPKQAIILKNNNGTAPGAIIEKDEKVAIILPGPPREIKPMFQEYVIPYLRNKSGFVIKSKVLRMYGISESTMAIMAEKYMDCNNPTVAPYAKDNDVILRITARGKSDDECLEIIQPVEEDLRDIFKQNIYGTGDTSLELEVGKILCKNNLTVATAESCTGGLVVAKLISYPGISQILNESIVTYSNEAKEKRLGVSKKSLDLFGAVSEQVAKEMAIGVAKTTNSRIGLSTTGIAGPTGGTKEKPVGLVYIGVSIDEDVIVQQLNIPGSRDRVRNKAALGVLDLLRRELFKRGIK